MEIIICIYSVRGEIDQISTNTFRYIICCAPNVYMFVYILIGTPNVPLKGPKGFHYNTVIHLYSSDMSFEKLTTLNEDLMCNQNAEINCLISGDFAFVIAV